MALTFAMPETTLQAEIEARAAAASRMSEEEFRAFYERTSRPVWAYLMRLTGDRHLADDLLQDAYYRFYRAGAVYEGESHRRNSLFRIATNLARDVARRKRRGTDVEIPESLESAPAHSDERTDLQRALAKLNPLHREIVWLAYAQGSSHAEIAEITGVSSKSIKSLLFRARKRLAEILRG
ncbi:MAG TPA: RNA polymerase sigma factor [Thermoanaerobaculia bacterium]|nr:RNA polymerase sigma factor [Thermoanaerobaculia bacterium]